MVWPLTVLLTSISGLCPTTVTCSSHVQADRGRHLNDDVLADEGLESLQGEDDLIGAGRQGEQAVSAVPVRHGGRLADHLRARRFDRDAGQRGARAVQDPAFHLGSRGLLAESGPGDEQREDRNHEFLTHKKIPPRI